MEILSGFYSVSISGLCNVGGYKTFLKYFYNHLRKIANLYPNRAKALLGSPQQSSLSDQLWLIIPKLSDFDCYGIICVLDSGLRRNDNKDQSGSRHAGLDPASS